MDVQTIITRYNGQSNVGVNNADDGQCTGLFERVMMDNGYPFEPGNAKDLFANADPSRFQKIVNNPNDPNQLPQPGDWFVFGPEPWNGGLGHVGMVVSAVVNSFVGLEQNNPADNHTVREVTHATGNPYAGMIGWLRPGFEQPTPIAGRWAVTNRIVNERVAPHLNATIIATPGQGTRFQVMDIVQGDNVGGNSSWVLTPKGFYIWTGNLTFSAS